MHNILQIHKILKDSRFKRFNGFTSLATVDPVELVTSTIFSKISMEEIKSPALISRLDVVMFFITRSVLLIFSSSFIPSSIMLSNWYANIIAVSLKSQQLLYIDVIVQYSNVNGLSWLSNLFFLNFIGSFIWFASFNFSIRWPFLYICINLPTFSMLNQSSL